MRHEDIRWNQETLEWFCAKCGRTSGRIKREDALDQLEEHKCELPTGESRHTPMTQREAKLSSSRKVHHDWRE